MKPSTAQDYHERIVRTLVYIQANLDNPLDLDHLANVAAFSRFHFHRIFRGLVGESLQEHIRRLRLERAAIALRRLDEPILTIALQAGFETHESFTRAFGDMFGLSPSAYRTAHRAASASASHVHFDDLGSYRSPNYGEIPAVDVKKIPVLKLIFLRHVGPYDQVGGTWGRLMGWAGSRGLMGPGMKLIGIVHDDPEVTAPDKLRYDAALAIHSEMQAEGDIGVMELPGGLCAISTHKGPYSELGNTYQKVYGGWLPHSGYRLRDSPAFEEYLNSPMYSPPAELLALIHVPLEEQ